jgi:phage shock protein C
MNTDLKPLGNKWVRSKEGILAGVCEGVGKRFEIDPWVIRLFWMASVFLFGTGLLLYVVLAICLPREDELTQAYEKRVMGVCHRIAVNTGMEIGLVRTLTVFMGIATLGTTIMGYVILYFVVPEIESGDATIVV